MPLDTPCEKVERAIAIIREKLKNHEGMDPEFPPKVFFDEFDPGGVSYRVHLLVHTGQLIGTLRLSTGS